MNKTIYLYGNGLSGEDIKIQKIIATKKIKCAKKLLSKLVKKVDFTKGDEKNLSLSKRIDKVIKAIEFNERICNE